MPQSLSQVVIHIIFSTKQREPFLDEKIIKEVHGYLASCARELDWECYRVGGIEDHVHLAVRQPRTGSLSDFMGHIKRTSTKWIRNKDDQYQSFSWQGGYGAFSVGYSQLENLIRYIDNQKEHHQKMTTQDEFRMFLNKYQIDYDEQYVWD
jgi:REP element-mobilizing transposase RayT